MKINTTIFFLISFSVLQAQTAFRFVDPGKPRLIVLTDIANEPDDQESMVRLLVYSNEFNIEGLIATTSTWLKNAVREDKIRELINAYGIVRANLVIHAKDYPTEAYLLSITKAHLPLYGMEAVGEGKESEGSMLIINAVDKEDIRPVWVSVWGGANCLAQALWTVKHTRTPDQVARFVDRLRVYTISDQDDTGSWIRQTFPGIFYIVSISPAGKPNDYHQATWTGISGDQYYHNGPGYKLDMVQNPWLLEHIINDHGPLGALYPELKYIMEGDTPAFLGLISNGLASSISPAYGGWGGRYDLPVAGNSMKVWTNTERTKDKVELDRGKTNTSDQATIWRWRQAYQNDFAARMNWCITAEYKKANHNPVVALNGDISKLVAFIKVEKGKAVLLSAKGSYDPDGNKVSYHWFIYREAGHYTDNLQLKTAEKDKVSFVMPALAGTEELHIICDVTDTGTPRLHSYRRVILTN